MTFTEINISASNPCLCCYLKHSVLCNPVLCMNRNIYINQAKNSINANQEIKKKPSKIPQPNSWGFYDVIESDLLNCVDKTEVPFDEFFSAKYRLRLH